MRRILSALFACAALVLTAVVGAAPANASPYSEIICFPIYGPFDNIIGWNCYEVWMLQPQAVDPGCPDCPMGIDFGWGVLPPEQSKQVTVDVQAGLQGLGAAATAGDPAQAQQLHAAAIQHFKQAAADLLGTQLKQAVVYYLDPNGGQVCCQPDPQSPSVQGANDISQGLTLGEQALAANHPEMWDAIVPMFDRGYAELAHGNG